MPGLNTRRIVVSVFVAGFMILAGGPTAHGQSALQPGAGAADQTPAAGLRAMTQALVALNALRQGGDAGAEAGLLDLAVQRQELIEDLIQSNPGAVLKTTLPAGISGGMPADVQALLGEKAAIEGTLQVIHVDQEDPGQSRYIYVLETVFGDRFTLHFASSPPGLQSGTAVRVNGILFGGVDTDDSFGSDGAMALESGHSNVEYLAPDGTTAEAAATAPIAPNTFGEQRTLAILVNFQDQPTEPYTPAFAHSAIFDTTSNFYLENSSQQTWLGGDVTGWYTIPVNSTACDISQISSAAQSAAAGAGIDWSSYSRLIYMFPKNACSWQGAATVGGAPSHAWINGDPSLTVTAHEVGHNFGLYHAHSLACADGSIIGSSCDKLEYGDGIDVMGWSPSAHFNAFAKEVLGWLNYDVSPPITTVNTGGTYSLQPYAANGTGSKALKFSKGTDAVTGKPVWYYVEYRQAIGFDGVLDSRSSLMDSANILNGVVIHTGSPEAGSNTGFLLDMTPETYQLYTVDPALTVGRSFTDTEAGVTITTEWADAGGAEVSVSFGPQSCTRANPDIALSPSESQWVEAGTPVTYTMTVTNRDSAVCNDSSFDLAATAPAGWTAAFAAASLNLAPGASGTTTLGVTSPSGTADGFYDIAITAANSNDAAFAASATATYVVSAAVNQAPVAVNDSATTTEGAGVTIGVLGNDSDPDGDVVSIATASQGSNGSVTVGGTSITYTPNAGFTGTDSFIYTISDGNGGSAGATVTVTVDPAPVVNQPPVAVDDSAVATKGVPVIIPVLSNDSDPEGDALAIISVSKAPKGSVTINADGTLTYTPGGRFKGNDSFTYGITDGVNTASATVTIGSPDGGSGGGTKGGGKGGGGGGGGKGGGKK